MLEAESVSGVHYLAPLKHRTGSPLETIVQMLPTSTLPDGLVAVVQEQVTCSSTDEEIRRNRSPSTVRGGLDDGFCGRVKYHVPYRRQLVHYSHSAFDGAPDVVLSAEWFGSGGAASQQVIVSNKVARLVLTHGWKGLELDPIELV